MATPDVLEAFLDRISDLPDEVQTELLAALMARQAEQLGLVGSDADL